MRLGFDPRFASMYHYVSSNIVPKSKTTITFCYSYLNNIYFEDSLKLRAGLITKNHMQLVNRHYEICFPFIPFFDNMVLEYSPELLKLQLLKTFEKNE